MRWWNFWKMKLLISEMIAANAAYKDILQFEYKVLFYLLIYNKIFLIKISYASLLDQRNHYVGPS